ncbi:MAG: hypothetical protein L0G99_16280 [Propionibacteriales bacterium]|nr:hypothetical protein [Propionibacteriales bacterium]
MPDPEDPHAEGRSADDQAYIDAEFAALVAGFGDTSTKPDDGPDQRDDPGRRTDRGQGDDPDHNEGRDRTSTVPGMPAPPNTTTRAPNWATLDPNTGYSRSRPVSDENTSERDDGELTDEGPGWRRHTPPDDEEVDEGAPEIPPLPPYRPSPTAVAGCGLLLLGAVLGGCLLFGLRMPYWVGWLALASLLGGVATLLSRLPRTRDPEDGDGARL